MEQLRATLDPMALGVRYVEIATICRESTDRSATHLRNVRGLLTAEQQERLTRLEAGMSLLPPITEGQRLALLGYEVKGALQPAVWNPDLPLGWIVYRTVLAPLPGCPSSGNGNYLLARGGLNADPAYPNLVRYLNLSDGQVERIVQLNGRFQEELIERQIEALALSGELRAERARPAPDQSVLGAKAAGLEQVCRDSLALEAEVQRAIPALLTEGQGVRWQELDRALQLLPALSEAQDVNMNRRAPSNPLPPPFSEGPNRSLEWTPYFSSSEYRLPGCGLGAVR